MLRNQGSRSSHHPSYEMIRDKILNGELEGGTKIVEEKLASELGFSRTPIRDSIRRLEYEGLIVRKKSCRRQKKIYATCLKCECC